MKVKGRPLTRSSRAIVNIAVDLPAPQVPETKVCRNRSSMGMRTGEPSTAFPRTVASTWSGTTSARSSGAGSVTGTPGTPFPVGTGQDHMFSNSEFL